MNSNNKINIRFIMIFILILGSLVYIIGNYSANNTNYIKNNASQVNQQQLWAEGDYKKAKDLKLDINAVNKALMEAKSPSDFEEKVNAIYQGDGIISINIQNISEKAQKIHLYIDKDPKNSNMEEKEKIISLQRNLVENGKAEVVVQGYGNYSHYSGMSPFMYSFGGSMAGSMVGNWLSNRQYNNYSTPSSRQSDLSTFKSNLTNNTTTSKSKWNSKAKSASSWKTTNNKTKSYTQQKPRSSSWFGGGSSRSRSWGSSGRSWGGRGFGRRR